jgi:hypothetical protein
MNREEYDQEQENIDAAIDDTVHCCPECERPNQFGELCENCLQEIARESSIPY